MQNNKPEWSVNSEQQIYDGSPWVSLYKQEVTLPDGHVVADYHRVKISDFTVIYAKLSDDKVLMLKQYKHGLGKVTYTLPGGMIEPGETPIEAAKRELLEETGYWAIDWHHLGSYVVNGNLGCGCGHFFKANYAIKGQLSMPGDLEDMELQLIPENSIFDMLKTMDISLLNHMACITLANTGLHA